MLNDPLLGRLRDLRKRRGHFRSNERASRELARLLALLPAGSIERELFEQTEILGSSYKTVAAELAVSERHLYRLRRRMIEMIDASELAQQPSGSDVSLETVWTLIKHGQIAGADAAARKLVSAGLAADRLVELLALEAIIACERGDVARANERLSRAEAMLVDVLPPERAGAERRLGMTRAHVSYSQGFYENTIEQAERALRPWFRLEHKPECLRSLARDFIFLGTVHQEGGSQERALDALVKAERLLRSMPEVPIAELAQVHVHRAFALASIAGRLDEARAESEKATHLAQTHGLFYEQVWANLAAGILSELSNDAPGALTASGRARDLAAAMLSGDPLVRTHFISSRVEIFAGKLDGTLDRLQQARGLIVPNSLLGAIIDLVEARVHRALADPKSTIASASQSIDHLERRTRTTHYLGEAYFARAVARHALGSDARDDAEHAVSLLKRGGWVSDQNRAIEFAARLTNS